MVDKSKQLRNNSSIFLIGLELVAVNEAPLFVFNGI